MKNYFQTNKNRVPVDESMLGNSEVAAWHQNPPGSQLGALKTKTTISLKNSVWCWEVTHGSTGRQLGALDGYSTKAKATDSARRFVKRLVAAK